MIEDAPIVKIPNPYPNSVVGKVLHEQSEEFKRLRKEREEKGNDSINNQSNG